MAVLTIQDLPRNGSIASLTFAAMTVADELPNDGRTILLVANGDAGVHTVSFAPTQDLGGLVTESANAITVTNGETGIFGPFDGAVFNAPDGNIDVTLDDATAMTYAAVRLARIP